VANSLFAYRRFAVLTILRRLFLIVIQRHAQTPRRLIARIILEIFAYAEKRLLSTDRA
jgi:hypothetical protein